jgi:ABC-type branched-subunit amino acid transport system substrate-binding protein
VVDGSGRNDTFPSPIFVPPTSTSFASDVAILQNSGAQGVLAGLPEVQSQAFVRAMDQAGSTLAVGVPASSTYPAQLAQLPPSFTSHLVIASLFKRSGPIYQGFVKAQDADGYPQFKDNDVAVDAYVALQMLVNMAKKLSHPTRAALVAQANQLASYSTGVTQPIDFQTKSKFLGGDFTRLTNTQVYYYRLSGGKYVAANRGQAYDITKAP